MTNKTLCPKAWTELAISPSGLLTPCCVFEQPLKKEDGHYFRAGVDSLEEVWNSTEMKEIRRKMLKGEKIAGCEQCYFQEAHSNISKRVESLRFYQDKKIEIDYSQTGDDGQVSLPITSLDLKLGNRCNLACRMCQPKDSNFVSKEFEKIAKENMSFLTFQNTLHYDPFLNESYNAIGDWAEQPHFKNQFDSISGSLVNVNIAGGEPLLLDEFYECLDSLIDSGQSLNCHLFISTNLTVLPEKVKPKIEQFKSVHWGLSVDCFGDRYSYIRYPGKWENFKVNLEKLREWYSDNEKIQVSLSPTIQIYNVLYLDELIQFYFEKVFDSFIFPNFFLNMLTYPDHLAIKYLPASVKKAAIEKLRPMAKKAAILQKHNNTITYDGICQVLGVLENEGLEGSKQKIYEFMEYTEAIDKKRNQSFSETFPEMANMIEEYLKGYSPEEDRKDLSAIKSLGFAKLHNEELDDALGIFFFILEQEEDPLIYRVVGDLYRRQSKSKKAATYFQKAIDKGDDDIHTKKTLGWLYKELGDTAKAVEYFKQALVQNPSDQDCINELDYMQG